MKPVACEFTIEEARQGYKWRGNKKVHCCYGTYYDMGHDADCKAAAMLPVDRGPLPEVSESDWAEFEILRNVDKGPTLARRDDQHAMGLQIQMQGYIGGLE